MTSLIDDIETEIRALLDAPEASPWLKHALLSALFRDCTAAAQDAQQLADLLDRRRVFLLKASLQEHP